MKKDIYKKIAKDVINTEIISLNKLKSSLDINFKKAVEKILNCKKGKVILSGVGKSGIIAKKISYELISKGVNSNTIDGIIYSKEIDWMKVLEKEFKKKYKSNADFSLDEISKAKKFFLQRGFNIELINEFFKR